MCVRAVFDGEGDRWRPHNPGEGTPNSAIAIGRPRCTLNQRATKVVALIMPASCAAIASGGANTNAFSPKERDNSSAARLAPITMAHASMTRRIGSRSSILSMIGAQ